jgi:hypothetical protein
MKKKTNKIKEWWLYLSRVYRFYLDIRIPELALSFGVELLDNGITLGLKGINWITTNYRLISKYKQLDELHYLEWELFWSPNLRTGFDFRNSIHTDHAGWHWEISILGFNFNVDKYDTRHWDYDTNAPRVYDEAYYAQLQKH